MPHVKWDKLSSAQLQDYSVYSQNELKKISLDHSLILCNDINCTDHKHLAAIDTLYNSVIDALTTAAAPLSKPANTRQHHQIPGWNEVVAELHNKAREAFLLWKDNGKQKQGQTWELMKSSRAQFKYALRLCKKQESILKSNALAKFLLTKDEKQFWTFIKDTGKAEARVPLAETVGGCTGIEEVANMWKEHFQQTLNVPQQPLLTNASHKQPEFFNRFSTDEVTAAFKKLKSGKSPGPDNLKAEHFKYAHHCCHVYLCLLFNSMLVHAYLPQDFMSTIIVPLVKDKKGDLCDVNNYRPIAITTVISKLFEIILLERCKDKFYTSDNQFGFKKSHGTEQCIFIMKQIIDFYTHNSSPVYLCFMDLSKAFDMVNHEKLFEVLQKRGIDFVISRILKIWYTTQRFMVKWGPVISKPFKSTNGTRQGSILSPYLFNVYIDDLSHKLKASGVGCHINNVCFNHLFYADDSVLIAPSPRALQILIDISYNFAVNSHLVYNLKKTKTMCITPPRRKDVTCPPFLLNDTVLTHVYSQSYLGFFINSEMCDEDSVDDVIRSVYIRGNTIKRKFMSCTENVKVKLFQTYCSSFYCCALWSNNELLERAKVCHNNVLRFFIKSNYMDSISGHFVNRNIHNFDILRRKSIISLFRRLMLSKNMLISTVVNNIHFIYGNVLASWKVLSQ